ncbi:G2 protein, putative [Plasmodium gallinaceum]|uniref:G2 protein, putative n=1 Tax=Plasmodium gallinaceum TaxID=5849 RepID=A0A1J1GWB2_PLAGA|nr:G2 protein, putative [Plasmodium gallinaceum]CRG96843.1 G2 protein, putative [Plasmodium gallinaceum]
MGQVASKEEEIERQNIYASYPGLEQQLDMVFACHDIDKQGKLPYKTVEMILRHFLMQCGFMEYVCRFVDENGRLDLNHVENYLSSKKLVHKLKCCGEIMLTLEEMKALVIIFLKKISDTYIEDQAKWMQNMKVSQEEQGKALEAAMSEYEKNVLFSHALKEQRIFQNNKKLGEWNDTIENAYEAQQEILRQFETKKREKMELISEKNKEIEIAKDYIQKIKEAAVDNRYDNSKCFVYPASSAPCGACTSAGAVLPYRRYKEPRQKKEYSMCI